MFCFCCCSCATVVWQPSWLVCACYSICSLHSTGLSDFRIASHRDVVRWCENVSSVTIEVCTATKFKTDVQFECYTDIKGISVVCWQALIVWFTLHNYWILVTKKCSPPKSTVGNNAKVHANHLLSSVDRVRVVATAQSTAILKAVTAKDSTKVK
jgi:hypothetical protein